MLPMVDRGKAGFKPATTVWQFTAGGRRVQTRHYGLAIHGVLKTKWYKEDKAAPKGLRGTRGGPCPASVSDRPRLAVQTCGAMQPAHPEQRRYWCLPRPKTEVVRPLRYTPMKRRGPQGERVVWRRPGDGDGPTPTRSSATNSAVVPTKEAIYRHGPAFLSAFLNSCGLRVPLLLVARPTPRTRPAQDTFGGAPVPTPRWRSVRGFRPRQPYRPSRCGRADWAPKRAAEWKPRRPVDPESRPSAHPNAGAPGVLYSA